VLNGAFMTLICLTGTVRWIAWAVPIDAGMAIVLWIGHRDGGAGVPGDAAVTRAGGGGGTPARASPPWGVFMAKSGLHAAGLGVPGGRPFSEELLATFLRADLWMDGALRLEQGFILSSVLLAAATVCVIERRFLQAAGWCLAGAGALGGGPRPLLPLDSGRHGALADTGLALGAGLPRHGGVLRPRALGDVAGRRRVGGH
jgi:AGZA family xanthine/uracil permease-like MFS transporter